MTNEKAKFQELSSNAACLFHLHQGNEVKVESVLTKFAAKQVEVQMDSDDFTAMEPDDHGFSIDSFKPASKDNI